MNIPTKTLKSGFSLPVYGMGLWQVGGRHEPDYSQDNGEIENIQKAIEIGITHFDTAEIYANGHSEELLGKVIQGADRKKLTIATKVSPEHHQYDALLHSLQGSLKRLQTDYIDLYLLHRYPPSGIPVEETMRAVNRLVDEGVVKHIGVCNLTPRRFDEVKKHTPHPVVCNQVHYNILVREAERTDVLKHCQENDTFLVAWGPVQKGGLPDVPIISELAKKYHKTSYQIAINWLISQKNVVTISKTSSSDHLKENLGAIDWEMEKEDIEKIRKEYPNQMPVSDRVPLDYPGDIDP